jgi:choline dehydrogenase-like flavoprotein
MSKLPDPFLAGMARGWQVTHGERGLPERVTCDVAIVGSGAGAGITAELLTRAGLSVVILEEGPLKTSTDFHQRESEAFASLYQEGGARKTTDEGILILQGRCVGGSTVVNWTSSFRTPPATLAHWQQHFGLNQFTESAMAPWFAQVEQRLNMQPWAAAPNENNALLRKGAEALGMRAGVITRNVKNCWNLGSCGMGCPTNAKQSMLITTIPAALDAGARLFHHTRVQRIEHSGGKATALICEAVRISGDVVSPRTMRVVAKHVVVAGGAINSPALLMRSELPDPHSLLGTRTFLHPVVMSAGVYEQRVDGWSGAPQSIHVDKFVDLAPDGPIGYKLEAQPIYPGTIGVMCGGYGPRLAERVRALPNTHVTLALLRDGFHDQSPGGSVRLNFAGAARLDYPLTDYVLEGARRAFLSMAEIQFAAGARSVLPFHEFAEPYTSWQRAKTAIAELPMQPLMVTLGSAHVMGGCSMAADESRGVIRQDGRHWQIENLSVHDGSLFPTSIGANPQLSIYGVTARLSAGLVKQLTGKDINLV